MKKLLFLSFCISLFVSTEVLAYSPVEGIWRNNELRVTLEVIETNRGFKAKHSDNSRWYYYRSNGNVNFRDDDGNRYILENRNTLVWRSNNGRRVIRFNRSNYRDDYYGDNSRYDRRDDRNHQGRGRYDDDNCYYEDYEDYRDYRQEQGRYDGRIFGDLYDERSIMQYVTGRWYSTRNNSSIRIRQDGIRAIRVKSRSGNIRFRATSPNTFIDNRGNKIRITSSGRLKYYSNVYDDTLLFLKDY